MFLEYAISKLLRSLLNSTTCLVYLIIEAFFSFSDVYSKLDSIDKSVFKEMISDDPSMLSWLRNGLDQTLLIRAASQGEPHKFQFLVQFDQDFSVVDKYERNVLHWIVFGFYKSHCVLDKLKLVERSVENKSFFHLLVKAQDIYGNSPLTYAQRHNDHEAAQFLSQYIKYM